MTTPITEEQVKAFLDEYGEMSEDELLEVLAHKILERKQPTTDGKSEFSLLMEEIATRAKNND